MITTEQRPGQAASAPGDGQRALRGQVAWACQSLAPTRVAKLQALLARLEPT